MKTELSVSSLKQAKLEGADPGFPGAQETAAGQISAGGELSGRAGDAVAFTAAPLSEPVGPADASFEALAGSLLYAKEVQGGSGLCPASGAAGNSSRPRSGASWRI